MKDHRFKFYRAGGVDQVQLTTGRDLVAIEHLDQKLWVALSCPVKGLEFDERTLQLIDTDGDGRVRAPELIGAVRWAASVLSDVEHLSRSSDSLPLAAINIEVEEGKLLLETARSLLRALEKPDALALSVEDAVSARTAFERGLENGDGVVPLRVIEDEKLRETAAEILSGVLEPKLDRSTEPGLTAEDVVGFFEKGREFLAWRKASASAGVPGWGEDTDAAYGAYEAVVAKIEDFFARIKVAEFDERALGALNRAETAFAPLDEKLLDRASTDVASFPLGRIAPGAKVPLLTGANPAWTERLTAFRTLVVLPLLGERDSLSEREFRQLQEKLAAQIAWREAKPTLPNVEKISLARLVELLEGDDEARLLALIQKDKDAEPRANALESVEKLVRYGRDLLTLANNFVSFRDFYQRSKKAIFQIGTLYIDQRATELCVLVNDPVRHATLAPLSRTFLLYCDVKNAAGEKKSIAAAITNGDVDNLMVGRNGLFYDRSGKDWDATITRIVDSPISVRQAFWAPYKKLLRLVEEQVNKRAAAAQAESDANVAAQAAHVDSATKGDVKAPAVPGKKLDIGVVAALGVAVGGITAALGALLSAFFGLGLWMPLGLVGFLLLISGPSMAIAWFKLRQRNIGPILDANGWAVNVMTKVNVPLGRSLTSVASLPPGASRDFIDPFAEKKKPWWLVVLIVLALFLALGWFLGKVDRFLPEPYRSVTVLGDAAPAKVRVKPEVPVAPAPAKPAAK